ncbi:YihY/virulence factor BrkB family protein [Luteirhabdus pelagi]|uniref:YihY/virulence factor BrkB family protein n=1 Tax=Luteirhabdus pelagi TaxID=2792783 RepID=UPI0019393E17|nr:YihY/virulence factor BrkB family protein [Luteirhabdus pelagi]
MKKAWHLLKNTYQSWDSNDPWSKSAVIAYYALFSLPSLLLITVYVAGIFFGRDAVQGRIVSEFGSMIGEGAAQALQNMIANAALENSSAWTLVIGLGMLLFAATGVFFQLQKALNDIWNVRAKEIGIKGLLKRRAVSLGVILAIGLLLLISLLISTAISSISDWLGARQGEISSGIIEVINFLLSQFFITGLFAALFTFLPDVKIRWKTTLLGAFFTTLLFLAAKYIIGFYFATSDPASVYGAAGSVVLILLWVYYTCLIMFFGAELTVQWALLNDVKVEPSDDATISYEEEIKELRAYKEKVEEKRKKSETLQQK